MQSLGQGSSQSSAKCGTLCRGLDYSGKARSINTFANHQTEVNIDKTVWSLDLSDLDAGQTPTLGRWPNPNTWTRAKPRQHLDWLGCWPNPDMWTLAKPLQHFVWLGRWSNQRHETIWSYQVKVVACQVRYGYSPLSKFCFLKFKRNFAFAKFRLNFKKLLPGQPYFPIPKKKRLGKLQKRRQESGSLQSKLLPNQFQPTPQIDKPYKLDDLSNWLNKSSSRKAESQLIAVW